MLHFSALAQLFPLSAFSTNLNRVLDGQFEMSCGAWDLLKYAKWENNEWKQTDPINNGKLSLVIKEGYLVVINGTTNLETVSLTKGENSLKVVQVDRTIGVGVKIQEKAEKFRVLFHTTIAAEKCIEILRKYSSILPSSSTSTSGTESLPAMLSALLQGSNTGSIPAPETIPEDFPLDSAVKLCIMDPGFPQLVAKVENIIDRIGIQKES